MTIHVIRGMFFLSPVFDSSVKYFVIIASIDTVLMVGQAASQFILEASPVVCVLLSPLSYGKLG